MFNFKKARAIAVLIGTTIGAGIFAIPYAFSQVGFFWGLVYLIILALIVLAVELCYGEIILRTKEPKEMAGYVETYSGKTGKIFISLSLILGIYAALTAYLIGVGTYLETLIGPLLGGNLMFWGIVFWALGSLICFLGIGTMSRFELLMSFCLIVLVFILFVISLPYLDFKNFSIVTSKNLFLPFGVILFALGGATALPTMRKILGEEAAFLKKAVLIGLGMPTIIYAFFAFIILGVTGPEVSEEALIGLSKFLGGKALIIGGIFGILAMATSFFALSFILKEFFRQDCKIKNFAAWVLTVSVPLFLFLTGFRFIYVIGISGTILSGFQGIILIDTYYKARQKKEREPEFKFNLPKLLAYLIYLVFIFGIIYQICLPLF